MPTLCYIPEDRNMDVVHCSVLPLHSWTQETSANAAFVDPSTIFGSVRADASEPCSITYRNWALV